jgi:hypothetical protein
MTLAGRRFVGLMTTGRYHRPSFAYVYSGGSMRRRALIALLLPAIALGSSRVDSQGIGGLIKKKAIDAAKGKDAKTNDDASAAKTDTCGPITDQKLRDYLRGLQAEAAGVREFNSMVAKSDSTRAESGPRIKACRDAENGGPTFQKMMTDGFTGPNAPSTGAAVQEQMAKNKAKWEEYLDKKCGKDLGPAPMYDSRDAYLKAHAAGARTAGMSEYCYDALGDKVIAFCKLSKKEQAAAMEKGIRVQKAGDWVFTPDEAKATQPLCGELLSALQSAGNTR